MASGKSSLETILASFQWLRNELTKYFFSLFFFKDTFSPRVTRGRRVQEEQSLYTEEAISLEML